MVTVTLVTRPPGAKIFIDGEEQPIRTPEPFKVAKGKQVKIVLKSAGFEDLVVPTPDLTEDRTVELTMKPKRRTPPPPDPNARKGSGSGTGKGSSDDSGLMPP
jgi:hypothetical protein